MNRSTPQCAKRFQKMCLSATGCWIQRINAPTLIMACGNQEFVTRAGATQPAPTKPIAGFAYTLMSKVGPDITKSRILAVPKPARKVVLDYPSVPPSVHVLLMRQNPNMQHALSQQPPDLHRYPLRLLIRRWSCTVLPQGIRTICHPPDMASKGPPLGVFVVGFNFVQKDVVPSLYAHFRRVAAGVFFTILPNLILGFKYSFGTKVFRLRRSHFNFAACSLSSMVQLLTFLSSANVFLSKAKMILRLKITYLSTSSKDYQESR